ncbi:MAG: GNAT family N-acetyltransferase [Proteobacteria bacterium]|nr:GNAT family N-acetyltransferase [Pseudomonadota bacterium]
MNEGVAAAMQPFQHAGEDARWIAVQDPWDTRAFSVPVARIDELDVAPGIGGKALAPLLEWMRRNHVRMASCRLPCSHLAGSMALEDVGFRFVEVMLHPNRDLLPAEPLAPDLEIGTATAVDVDALAGAARVVFGVERYHSDPRIPSALADARYAQWVRSAHADPCAHVSVVRENGEMVAFFIWKQDAGTVDWRLTAVMPRWQGRGLGARCWRAMLAWHAAAGATRIVTSVTARNTRALALYVRLGFRFAPPEMTFHWVAP